jgi:hypothetical protein
MKTQFLKRFVNFKNQFVNAISDKRMCLLIVFLLFNVSFSFAAGDDSTLANTFYAKLAWVFQGLSAIMLIAILYFGLKAGFEGLRGEQGAWMKLGGIVLIAIIWFAAMVPFINYLKAQAQTATFN